MRFPHEPERSGRLPMNFQQLRSVRETVRQGFNLTAVAQALHTSQPGVSRQIRELEDELGVEIFVRAGKRLTGLTAPGETVLPIVERLLHEADNLRRAGADFASQGRGTLTIAATHSQARYALPPAVRDFSAAHPDVALRLHQGSPRQVADLLLAGEADIGVATEALASYPELVALPCYQWTHAVIVPPGHPLAQAAEAGPGHQPLEARRRRADERPLEGPVDRPRVVAEAAVAARLPGPGEGADGVGRAVHVR